MAAASLSIGFSGLHGWLRGLARDARGVVIVEFAIVLPVLLTMYLGGFVISDMIACNRKVTVSARSLADLTSRNISPSLTYNKSSVDAFITASTTVLLPYSTSAMQMRISDLQICDASHAIVIWSDVNSSVTSLVTGATVSVPSTMITAPMLPTGGGTCANPNGTGAYFFEGEVYYPYTPVVKYGPLNITTLADVVYMSPRLT